MFPSSQDQTKRRTAIYIRVSTQEQKIDGYGLESQKMRLLSYIEDNRALNLVTKPEWIFCDVHTGSELQREGLQKLLKLVETNKIDSVMVWKIDRLSRDLKHLLGIFESFQKHGVSFVSMQENIDFNGPIGNLIFQIFGSIAQFERELIKTRTMAGKITSAEMGNFTGSQIPFGYKPVPNENGKGKKLKIVPEEQKVVEDIFHWYVYEEMGYAQIANRLNDLEISRGKFTAKRNHKTKWIPKHIETIIPNTLYRGEFLANKKDEYGNVLPQDQWTVVGVPACVGEFLFSLAQQKRTTRAGKSLEKGHVYILAHKLIDVSIPEPKKFYGIPRTNGGYSYRRKQFSNRDEEHFPVFEIAASSIEETIWKRLKLAFANPEEFIKRALNNEKGEQSHKNSLLEELTALREKRVNIELEIERIEKAYESGVYNLEKMEHKTLELNAPKFAVNNRIQQIEDDVQMLSLKNTEIQNLRDTAKQINYNLDHFTRKQKKMLIDICIDRIEVDRKEDGNNGMRKKWLRSVVVHFRFNPERLRSEFEKGRIQKSHDDAGKLDSKLKNVRRGTQRDGRCTFFTCRFYIEMVSERQGKNIIRRSILEER